MILLPTKIVFSPYSDTFTTYFNLPVKWIVDLEYYGLGADLILGLYNSLGKAQFIHTVYRSVDHFFVSMVKLKWYNWTISYEEERMLDGKFHKSND